MILKLTARAPNSTQGYDPIYVESTYISQLRHPNSCKGQSVVKIGDRTFQIVETREEIIKQAREIGAKFSKKVEAKIKERSHVQSN